MNFHPFASFEPCKTGNQFGLDVNVDDAATDCCSFRRHRKLTLTLNTDIISSNPTRKLLPLFIILLLCYSSAMAADEDDIRCLRGIHTSLTDPHGALKSWNFANTTVGFLCNFVGVSCWNNQENRVLSLELRDMSLSGQIPESLRFCGSLQKLDLSSNRLTGTIPNRLCSWLPFLVSLDLSNNQLNGEIPTELAECRFVNSLVLSDNRLSGQIP
ncbi:hypothetical protein Bca52824_068384, partial [Brassica carinata]